MTTDDENSPAKPNIAVGKDVLGNVISGNDNTINVNAVLPVPPPSPLFTIPAPPENFTGRTAELDELLTHFAGAGAAISGVSGGGGVGKSALARKLAYALTAQYPDAHLYIDLHGASGQRPLTPVDALQSLLRSFYPASPLPDELDALRAILIDALRSRRVLFLLDNARDAAQVRPLLPPAPSAAIITSRTHIPLADAGLRPLRLGALRPDEARALLRRTPSLQNAADAGLDVLARLCGALPLALNVVAALLDDRPDWNLQGLIARLSDERARLQTLKMPNDPDLDVEASLGLSYKLLDEETQRLFRTLGIFPAPFDLPALGAIWGLPPAACDEAIGRLLRLSLIEYHAGEAMPYALHDLTRLYAEAALRRQPEEWATAYQRHADYFLQQAIDADNLYEQGHEHVLESLRQFDVLWPHLQAAYVRALPNVGEAPADRWLSDLPGKVAYTLDIRITPRQRIPLLESALAAARRLGNRSYEDVHLGNLGIAYKNLGEPRRAIEYYEQQLPITHEIGDRRGEGNTLGNLGNAYADLGELRRAIEYYEQHQTITREIGDRRGEGAALGNLGLAYADLGEPRRAIEYYEQCLIILREIGDRLGEGIACWNMGLVLNAQGQFQQAVQLMQVRVDFYIAIGHPEAETLAQQVEEVRKKGEQESGN